MLSFFVFVFFGFVFTKGNVYLPETDQSFLFVITLQFIILVYVVDVQSEIYTMFQIVIIL